METIKFGKYVSLAYEIFVVDGGKETSVFKFSQSKPDSFVYGMDQTMIDAFMKHIEIFTFFKDQLQHKQLQYLYLFLIHQ